MKLYLIQDSDRPMHVVAASWTDALNRWKLKMSQENDCETCDVEEPQGIALICDQDELLVSESAIL